MITISCDKCRREIDPEFDTHDTYCFFCMEKEASDRAGIILKQKDYRIQELVSYNEKLLSDLQAASSREKALIKIIEDNGLASEIMKTELSMLK